MQASVSRSRPYTVAIWVALLAAALMGVLKPGAPVTPAEGLSVRIDQSFVAPIN
jgi:hypothetical protein